MAKGIYGAIDGKTRKTKKAYGVVDGVTKKIKKMYSVVDGKTRLCFGGEKHFIGIANRNFKTNSSSYNNKDAIFIGNEEGISFQLAIRSTETTMYKTICCGGGKILIVSASSGIYYYSSDGYNWTSATYDGFKISRYAPIYERYIASCYGNGKFYVYRGNRLYTSPDGITWTYMGNCTYNFDFDGNHFNYVTYYNGYFFAIGSGTDIESSYYYSNAMYSMDGQSWNLIASDYSESSEFSHYYPTVNKICVLGKDNNNVIWVAVLRVGDYDSTLYNSIANDECVFYGISDSGVQTGKYIYTANNNNDYVLACSNSKDKLLVGMMTTGLEAYSTKVISPKEDGSWALDKEQNGYSSFSSGILPKVGTVNNYMKETIACYSDIFVTIGGRDGYIYYSTDGINWTLGGQKNLDIIDGSGDGATIRYTLKDNTLIDISDL